MPERWNTLAQEIDFHDIFKLSPTAMALLTGDLVFIDANDAFLDVVRRPLEDLAGHNFFERFPKMPPDPGGHPMWTALERAMTSGRRECDRLIRYDVEGPARRVRGALLDRGGDAGTRRRRAAGGARGQRAGDHVRDRPVPGAGSQRPAVSLRTNR
jgi:PAS domain-containing protein